MPPQLGIPELAYPLPTEFDEMFPEVNWSWDANHALSFIVQMVSDCDTFWIYNPLWLNSLTANSYFLPFLRVCVITVVMVCCASGTLTLMGKMVEEPKKRPNSGSLPEGLFWPRPLFAQSSLGSHHFLHRGNEPKQENPNAIKFQNAMHLPMQNCLLDQEQNLWNSSYFFALTLSDRVSVQKSFDVEKITRMKHFKGWDE